MRGPFTTRHYPNLPTNQQAVQRVADEFNGAEREWERTHPAKPKRKLEIDDLRRLLATRDMDDRDMILHHATWNLLTSRPPRRWRWLR